jgi:hypothetical protein
MVDVAGGSMSLKKSAMRRAEALYWGLRPVLTSALVDGPGECWAFDD